MRVYVFIHNLVGTVDKTLLAQLVYGRAVIGNKSYAEHY